jgi:hypothetical protein
MKKKKKTINLRGVLETYLLHTPPLTWGGLMHNMWGPPHVRGRASLQQVCTQCYFYISLNLYIYIYVFLFSQDRSHLLRILYNLI